MEFTGLPTAVSIKLQNMKESFIFPNDVLEQLYGILLRVCSDDRLEAHQSESIALELLRHQCDHSQDNTIPNHPMLGFESSWGGESSTSRLVRTQATCF